MVLRLLFFAVALGNGLANADAAKTLAERLESMQSFSASFAQQIATESGDILENSTGEILLKRPHKLLWKTFDPFPLTVLANDESVYIYDEDLAQVTELELQEVLSTTPAGIILTAGESLGEEFVISEAPGQDAVGRVYSLVPISQESEFARLDISFDGKGLRGLFIEDVLGQMSYVSFRDRSANSEIADSEFEISFPEGVDWVKR